MHVGDHRREALRRRGGLPGSRRRRGPSLSCSSPPASTLATLEDACGAGVAVVWAMPNTPALVGEGGLGDLGGAAVGEDDLAWAEAILAGVGTVVRVPEHSSMP